MSLVNDVLRDLQARQASSAQPLAGLRATGLARPRRVPVAVIALAAAGTVSAAALAASGWMATDQPPALTTVPVAASVAEPAADGVAADDTAGPSPSLLQLAGVDAFAASRRSATVVVPPRAQTGVASGRQSTAHPVTVAQTVASAPVGGKPEPRSGASLVDKPVRRLAAVPRLATADPEDGPDKLASVVVRTARPATAAQAIETSRTQMATGDSRGAIARLSQALQQFPDDAALYRAKAELQAGSGQSDAALATLRSGVEMAANPDSLVMLLARRLVDAGRDSEALAMLDARKPGQAGAGQFHTMRAALLQRTGRHAEAVIAYQLLVSGVSPTGTHWVGLAISREHLGQPAAALEAYRNALGAAPMPAALSAYAGTRIAALVDDGAGAR